MATYSDADLLGFVRDYLPDNNDELIEPEHLRYVLNALIAGKANLAALAGYAQLASPRFSGQPQVPTAPAGTNSEQAASTAFVLAALATVAGGKNLGELTLPQDVQGGNWYLVSDGIWEARRSFSAAASPVNGPNWRQVASFSGQLTTLPAASISDATAAGRAMLTAVNYAAQRALVNNPRILAGQYGDHPAFTNEDGVGGAWEWVIKAILNLRTALVPAAPAAPTAGQVDDTADTFSFVPNPAYPSFASYKVNGLPGVTGAVVLDSQNSYVQGSRVYVKVVGAVVKGGLAVYVAGSGAIPDGKVLPNADPFTGSTPTPTGSLTPGTAQGSDSVTFTSAIAS